MTCTGAARIVFASALIVCCVSTGKTAQADVVTDWNVIALNATTVPPNSVLQSRTLAIVHAAVYDAVASLDQSGRPYAVDLKAPAGASVDAAIAAAAHGVLMRLAPGQRLVLDEALNTALSRIAPGQAKTDGIATGQKVAERMVATPMAVRMRTAASSHQSTLKKSRRSTAISAGRPRVSPPAGA